MREAKLYPLTTLLRAAEESSLKGKPAAIGAFNVNFYAQAEGILLGLRNAHAPGIIQASRGANKFQGGPDKIKQMVERAMARLGTEVPIALHLDHGTIPTSVQCIDAGYTGVMIDASHLSELENIALCREIAEYAHTKGVGVEGEYGRLSGVEEDIESQKTVYADPLFVPGFFDRSGVDALAIAYGTSHGANKGKTDALKTEIVKRSYNMMTAAGQNKNHFLVGHGSSTVPISLVEEINRFGGTLTDTSGVPMHKIQEAIAYGLRKVNIDTDLRLGITATFRKFFAENKRVGRRSKALQSVKHVFDGKTPAYEKGKPISPGKLIDPRSYLQPVMDTNPEMLREDYEGLEDREFAEVMRQVKNRVAGHVEFLVSHFGSEGLAGKVKSLYLVTSS